jgi:glycosyltransferase involved in cell wall biosynthesis
MICRKRAQRTQSHGFGKTGGFTKKVGGKRQEKTCKPLFLQSLRSFSAELIPEFRLIQNSKLQIPMPLFSIITPSYQARAKLGDTFASVMDQPAGLFDYWIVDGASSDGTREWLESRNEPTFHWVSENDSGVYDAMNKGIGLSQGRFLLFLGAGDRLLPGSLQKMADFIQQKPSSHPRFIYGDVRDLQTGQPFTAGHYSKIRMCHRNICHQGIFYERPIFDLLGQYELRYPIMADWAFNLKCFGSSEIRKLHFPAMVADFEGGGLCSQVADALFTEDRRRLIADRIGLFHALRYRVEEAVTRRLHLPPRGS